MGRPTGSAYLPLHGGRVPAWLAARMARLGRVITEAIVLHYSRDEFLRRLAHPFWFQSLGAIMGMDWHSSGITTSVMGALKRGLAPVGRELGIHVCGGRGRHSRKTPAELAAVGELTGLDGDALAETSRLVAKVDSAAVQDGFELYLHSFVVCDDGAWVVVQQGMNATVRRARRYHWLSEGLRSFVERPHAAIHGPSGGEIVNLTDTRAALARAKQLELLREGPEIVVATLARLREDESRRIGRPACQRGFSELSMPARHDVQASDVVLRRLHGTLAAAAERGPRDFAELLLTPGVGARTIVSLAMVSEVIHGAAYRFSDPARFSLAHGGKDGHPFAVSLTVYDETIGILRAALARAKLGAGERMAAIRRLDRQARALERCAGGPTFERFVEQQRRLSADLAGAMAGRPARLRRRRRDHEVSGYQPSLPGMWPT